MKKTHIALVLAGLTLAVGALACGGTSTPSAPRTGTTIHPTGHRVP